MNIILTDIDGCVLNWFDGFCQFVKNIRPDIVFGEPDYCLEKYLNISSTELHYLMDSFHNSEYYGNLPTLKSSEKWLPKLHELGYIVIAITNCAFSENTVRMRKENIENIFNNIFSDILCMPYDFDKTNLLKQFPKSYWVEDSPKWAKAGQSVGHYTFLINHEYNASFYSEGILRVSCWEEISNDIIS